MPKYILRWQIGITDGVKLHYTYGSKEMLEQKAEMISLDPKVVFVSIDKVDKVIKDIRTEETIKWLEGREL